MIQVRLLGAFDIRAADGAPIETLTKLPKRVAVLSYLLLASPRGFWRRDSLLALFWPEGDGDHARASLRGTLHRIRTALGNHVIATRGKEDVAVAQGQVWCDALEFERLLALHRYEAALQLYRGHLLDGFYAPGLSAEFEHWLDDERGRLQTMAAQAAAQLAMEAQRHGDYAGAEHWQRARLSFFPADEMAAQDLARVLAMKGDRAGGIKLLRVFIERTRSELSLEPSGATLALIHSLQTDGNRQSTGERITSAGREDVAAEPVAGPVPIRRIRRYAAVGGVIAMLATLSLRVHSPSAPRLAADVAAAMPAPSVKITGNAIPLGREQNSATLDARHGYLVVFGGRQATKIFDDVWRLDVPRGRAVSSWTPVPTEGPAPRARWGHTAVYDTTTDAMIVFGGAFGFSSPCTNQTWILHNASGHFGRPSWQLLQPSGTRPGPRANHTATYDAKRNRMFVFGGHDCVALRFGDTWILEHANGKGGVPVWRLLRPDTKGALPVGRSNHIAGYSSAGDAFFIYGGVTSDGEILRDGWRLRGTVGDGNAHWERLRIQDAPPRGFYAGAFDLEKFRVLLFGGLTPEGRQIAQLWSLQLPRSSTSGSFWRQVGAFEPAAVPGSTAPAVFDPIGHELLLFGGHGQGGERYDTWSFAVR